MFIHGKLNGICVYMLFQTLKHVYSDDNIHWSFIVCHLDLLFSVYF